MTSHRNIVLFAAPFELIIYGVPHEPEMIKSGIHPHGPCGDGGVSMASLAT